MEQYTLIFKDGNYLHIESNSTVEELWAEGFSLVPSTSTQLGLGYPPKVLQEVLKGWL